jgi:hypothetical protein
MYITNKTFNLQSCDHLVNHILININFINSRKNIFTNIFSKVNIQNI